MNFLKNIFRKTHEKKEVEEYNYRYFFRYDATEIVGRARAINTVALEAAAHLPALVNLLGQTETLSDDTAAQVDDAIRATTEAIEAAMESFTSVIKMSSETEYTKVRV